MRVGQSARPSGSTPPDGRAVYLVTSADQPTLGEDDQLLQQALAAAGVPVHVAVWTDADVDWAGSAVCVVRSVWDYHLKPTLFRRWLTAVGEVTTLLNPPSLMAWNIHKRYLMQLAALGAPTIETVWITRGTRVALAALLAERGWTEGLVKPAISASAWKTAKVSAGDQDGQRLVEDILQHTDVMVQPYLNTIERDGEISLVAIAGELTHAARRASALTSSIATTRRGDTHTILEEERRLATDILALLPTVPLYARIDLARDERGRLRLGELELIEPVLYLRHSPNALQSLVAELVSYTSAIPVSPTLDGAQTPRSGRGADST